MQGGRTVNDGDRPLHPRIICKPVLETVHITAHRRDPAGVQALFYISPFITGKSRLVEPDRSIPPGKDALQGLNKGFDIQLAIHRW